VFLLLPNEMLDFSKSLMAVSVFASNILFWTESGYFGISSELIPLIHTWSLSVEEQFYVLYPLLILLTWSNSRCRLYLSLLAIFIISFILAQWGSHARPDAAFYLLPTRAWELCVGVFAALFLLQVPQKKINIFLCEINSFIGFFLIIYSVLSYNSLTPFPGIYALVPTFGSFLIIIFCRKETLISKLLSAKYIVFIGLISYSAYLWHQPLLAFAKIYTVNKVGFGLSLGLVLLTFFLSIITYKYIETPFRNKNIFGRNSIFFFSIVGLFFFFSTGWLWYYKNGLNERYSPDILVAAKAIDDWYYPGDLSKTKIDKFYKYDLSKPIDILFFGDSHAEHFAPLAEQLSDFGFNSGFLTSGGCPPIPNVYDDSHSKCIGLFDQLNNVLSKENNIKNIVISGCFNCYLTDYSWSISGVDRSYSYYYLEEGSKFSLSSIKGTSKALKSLQSFLVEIDNKANLVVIGDNPVGDSFDPFLITNYMIKGEHYFAKNFQDFSINNNVVNSDQVKLNNNIQMLVPVNAAFINSLDIICPDNICTTFDENGRPIYKDNNHMRPFFVKSKFGDLLLELF